MGGEGGRGKREPMMDAGRCCSGSEKRRAVSYLADFLASFWQAIMSGVLPCSSRLSTGTFHSSRTCQKPRQVTLPFSRCSPRAEEQEVVLFGVCGCGKWDRACSA